MCVANAIGVDGAEETTDGGGGVGNGLCCYFFWICLIFNFLLLSREH
jgi:hypothetical protein